MTQRVWPPAFPLDPDARVLPAPLAAALASAGAVAPVILLVAGPGALEGDWAPQIAVALAEAWSREGPRLVLADLGVGAPTLERLVSEPNDEGLADVFLYGASLRRVIRGSTTRGFGFIPAGTAPADSEAVLTDPGWRQVVSHFFRDGAVLLCYAPWSAAGLDALATRLGAVIALATPEDLESLESAIPAEPSILAVVGPQREPAGVAVAPVPSVETSPVLPEALPEAEAVETSPVLPEALPEAEAVETPPGVGAGSIETVPMSGAAEPVAEPPLAAPSVVPAEAAFTEPFEPPAAAEPERMVEHAGETFPEPASAEAAATPEEVPVVTEEDRRWMPPAEQGEAVPGAAEVVEGVTGAAEAGEGVAAAEGMAADGADQAGLTEEERRRARVPESPREALVEALWARRAGGPGRQGAAPQVDPVPGREVTEHERMAEPFVLLRDRHAPDRHWSVGHVVLWVSIGAVAAILAILAYEIYVGNVVLPPAVQRWVPIGKPAAPAAPAATRSGLVPKGAVAQPPVLADSLPFSVAIEAYPQYAPAVERATTLRKEQSEVSFFVTPALDHGSIYYHVMAGPVADSLVAVALMQRLIDAGVKSGGSDFDIVATRLAFDLGDFASSADADTRAAEMAQKNIPTYVVEVPTPGGPSRWRLYAGAFQGAADANVLRPLLRGAGVPDSLVPRIGRSPK